MVRRRPSSWAEDAPVHGQKTVPPLTTPFSVKVSRKVVGSFGRGCWVNPPSEVVVAMATSVGVDARNGV